VTDLGKSSTCIDCPTMIIGERLRCPACHQRHAVTLVGSLGDDDATTRRPRAESDASVSLLARWAVVLEVIVAVVLGLVLAVKGCSS